MRQFGLIGKPLKHSFSPSYFKSKFENEGIDHCSYSAFELDSIHELHSIISKFDLQGFNVTIPYKQDIIPFLHKISSEAAAMNAVNVVNVVNGKLEGFNTDLPAFQKSFSGLIRQGPALILGTGGSAHMVRYALMQMGIKCEMVSRESELHLNYTQLYEELIAEHKLIINTTPLGMFPAINESPSLNYEAIGKEHVCIDLIYNPDTTLFLKNCAEQGAKIKNGLEMLKIQAELSWKIWEQD